MIAYTPAVETALIVLCIVSGVGKFAAVALLARGGAGAPMTPAA